MDLTRGSGATGPEASEALYEILVGYAFARRFVEGKAAVVVAGEGLGPGSRLLAGSAASVTGLTDSAEHAELAAKAHPAPNVEHKETADLSKLPYPDYHFDAVVALGVIEGLEEPEGVLKEVRRVLKADGVLVASARDRRAMVGGRGGVYVREFRELLERHFGRVSLYGQGAVAGGLVFPISGEASGNASGASVEAASLSLTDPRLGEDPPPARSVLAVCGEGAPVAGSADAGGPYLLLDRDRRLFDEVEDRAEDVGLLREEVRRMQETEVQAFQDSLKLHRTEIAYLRAEIRRSRAQLHAMQNATTWRIFEPYRQIRTRIDKVRGRLPGGKG